MRKNLFGPKEATYSGYTCYTGIADFVPADIDSVGYGLLYSGNSMPYKLFDLMPSKIWSSHRLSLLIGAYYDLTLILALFFEGTEYSWATNNTLFLQMWVQERCNGMHFTMNRLVEWMVPVVNILPSILICIHLEYMFLGKL